MPVSSDNQTILSVSELTAQIRRSLESDFGRVLVEGEVSGFKRHSSGHCYFALKDRGSVVQCIMYRSDARRLTFEPDDGMLAHASGQISVYPPRGQYQLVVRAMQIAGEGALRRAFETMKKRLAKEGLFDVSAKSALPPVPSTIGVVTSRDGAAFRDIAQVLQRRYPAVRLVLRATPVQGIGAATQIAAAINDFNLAWIRGTLRADVLIVGRGGGSEEDLWAFNEEVVARAIFASRIPVISAVGHETDISIADLVADVRAPTPSAAAELVVPDRLAIINGITRNADRLKIAMRHAVVSRTRRVNALVASSGFNEPLVRLRMAAQRTDDLLLRLRRGMAVKFNHETVKMKALTGRLESLDPRKPLERGFALVEGAVGPVTRAAGLEVDDMVVLRFADGKRSARITDDP